MPGSEEETEVQVALIARRVSKVRQAWQLEHDNDPRVGGPPSDQYVEVAEQVLGATARGGLAEELADMTDIYGDDSQFVADYLYGAIRLGIEA